MRAGFGKYNITPRVGVELYGFGPFLNRVSIGIRDILEARSAAFEAGGHTVVIITCDLCTLQDRTVAEIRSLIREKHPELKDADIMVNASHTHSGPATLFKNTGWGVTDPPWFMALPYKIAESAFLALDAMEEVTLAHALVPCRHIGLNRVYDKDAPPLEEVLKENWEPAKPELTDTECRVIRFDSVKTGKLTGFMAYFGCHPVVCTARSHYIHGDFPGVAMHDLMREFPGSVGMFLQGAEGNVNSGCVHKGEQESLLALDVFAARFANSIRNGLEKARPMEVKSIEAVSKVFPFSARSIYNYEMLETIRKEQEKILLRADSDDSEAHARKAAVYLRGIEDIKKILDSGKTDRMAELQIIRMGDLQFMGTPFEVMQAIKNDVHAASSAPCPMLMSLTNGAFSYAPDNHTLKEQKDNIHALHTNMYGYYEAIVTPLVGGRLPYADIHNEIVRYMSELEKMLGETK